MGGPRFRILGGGGGGGGGGGQGGGANSQLAHDVVTTSMRRNDVASTSFRRRVPIRFLINQCQIITFLILKYDIIENSRIELRGIVLPVQMGGLLGGEPKGMLAPPPLKLLGGAWPPWPPLFLRLWNDYSDMILKRSIDTLYKRFHITTFHWTHWGWQNVILHA